MPTILFLCTGNYYRSRFAEHLFNALAERRSLPWTAASRGLALERGSSNVGPIAKVVLAALEARGVTPAASHRLPAQAEARDFAAAGRVIALYAREHRPLVQERFPAWATSVEYWDAPDSDELAPAAALARIEHEVRALVDELAAAEASGDHALR